MSFRRIGLLCIAIVCLASARRTRIASGDEWQPVSSEELKMTSVPAAPGAPAVYLYRQVDRDDDKFSEYNYARIKILTEEGRKYADVEIPFFKESGNIHGIKARTIRPDGSIVNFDGKVFEKTIVKAKGLKYLAKTFTMPDVQVGSIIEYHYTYDWQEYVVYDSHWILSEELFTRRAKFSLKPNSQFALRWSWPVGLPSGAQPPKEDNHTIRMEAQNIPAFQIEDFMPPENELKFRVDFIYTDGSVEKDGAKYWKAEGKKKNDSIEGFVNKRKAMEQAAAQIVSASDTPEMKLQKIYARVQQMRNLSFEHEKTEQEAKREKLKEIKNVEELWKQGYGNGRQLTWLFLGLARGAGFDASAVLVANRSQYFFNPALMNSNELNDNIVLVKLNGKDLYFDPGAAFTPFGLLPWAETGVKGLKVDKDGGSWITTPIPEGAESRIDRKADLKLSDDGTLEGKLTITYSGLEARWRRLEERNEDDATRKKFLEDQVREYIPVAVDVELTNQPEWNSSASMLTATYDLKVQGWVSGAGRRALLPVGLFAATEKHVFEHANRVHPIYFEFPFLRRDEISIQLPLGWKVSSLPQQQGQDAKAIAYTLKVENKSGVLQLDRTLRTDLLLVQLQNYSVLRSFFQMVRTGDEQQIVLLPGSGAASN